jgi:hypothetical protein
MFIGVYMSLRKTLTKNIVDLAQALVGLKVAGELVTANISTAYTEVKKGNIIRIVVTADTYVAFAKEGGGAAVTAATKNGLLLQAGDHYVYCTEDFIRASAAPARVELLKL